MDFMPFQPIEPLTGSLSSGKDEADFSLGDTSHGSNAQMPFESYLQQAFTGVNDAIWDSATLQQKAITGQVKNLHEVSTSSAEAYLLLKIATGVASKITTAATTLFQMQF